MKRINILSLRKCVFPPGKVIGNSHIYLDRGPKENGHNSVNFNMENGECKVNRIKSDSTRKRIKSVSYEDIGEMCVYGDSLALGYVGIGGSDKFFTKRINDGEFFNQYHAINYVSNQYYDISYVRTEVSFKFFTKRINDGELSNQDYDISYVGIGGSDKFFTKHINDDEFSNQYYAISYVEIGGSDKFFTKRINDGEIFKSISCY